jgi:hypothetical protein
LQQTKSVDLAQEIGFFCTKFVQLAVASKMRNTIVHRQKILTAAQYFLFV